MSDNLRSFLQFIIPFGAVCFGIIVFVGLLIESYHPIIAIAASIAGSMWLLVMVYICASDSMDILIWGPGSALTSTEKVEVDKLTDHLSGRDWTVYWLLYIVDVFLVLVPYGIRLFQTRKSIRAKRKQLSGPSNTGQ